MREILFVVLGWLFGLLTGPITDAIRRRRAAREIAVALAAELRGIRERAVVTAQIIRSHHGTLDREHRQWIVDNLQHSETPNIHKVGEGIRESLKLSDEQIKTLNQQMRSDSGVSVRRLETPFLDSQMHRIGMFRPTTQQWLMQARVELRMYNELADEARRFRDITFGNVTPEDRTAAITNARGAEAGVVERAEEIVRAIPRSCEVT